jgi:hypothetical protein
MIFLAKNINFSDIYSTKCLKKCMIKITYPKCTKRKNQRKPKFFTVKMASQEDS